MNILEKILANKKANFDESRLKQKLKSMDLFPKKKQSFYKNIKGKKKLGFITEIKMASPSKGKLRLFSAGDLAIPDIVNVYEKNNASAISVITEEKYFLGSNQILTKVAKMTNLPILRKDFLWHPLQIEETAKIGADAVLMIASILTKEEIKVMKKTAEDFGIEILFEVHSKEEFEKYFDEFDCIGINNRNLKNMTTDINHSINILKNYKKSTENKILVSESGIKNKKDIENLSGIFDAVLIGTSLVESENPGKMLRDLS